jgi:hypothetical protein
MLAIDSESKRIENSHPGQVVEGVQSWDEVEWRRNEQIWKKTPRGGLQNDVLTVALCGKNTTM